MSKYEENFIFDVVPTFENSESNKHKTLYIFKVTAVLINNKTKMWITFGHPSILERI